MEDLLTVIIVGIAAWVAWIIYQQHRQQVNQQQVAAANSGIDAANLVLQALQQDGFLPQ